MSGTGNVELSDMGRYEFSDVAGISGEARSKEKNACQVKITTGFILLFLSLIVAAGVGIIVHFAENRKIECNFPDSASPVKNAPQTGSQTLNLACRAKAQTNSDNICAACPKKTSEATQTQAPPSTVPTRVTTTRQATYPTTQPSADVRLPKNVYPQQYDLDITPYLYGNDESKFYFRGKVGIRVECRKETNTVTLHSNKLQIKGNEITFIPEDHTEGDFVFELTEDQDRQFLHLKLDKELVKGHFYLITIEFTGKLATDLKGFYLSSYMEGDQRRYLATTQFQPTDARKAFPCFDEPEFKAVFNITIGRKSGWQSLSNTKIVSSFQRGYGVYADQYSPTPKMSTYLVAFVVSKFQSQHKTTQNGLKYGVWARPDSILQTSEALNVGTKVITFYENYFNISFPLPKQEMISIPDYPLGAMENWGLITYRETAMLYDPELSTEDNKGHVLTAITHELSHQWFGDLVTMKWWDDLWLNEGFATFIEYLGADHVYPDWNMLEQFPIMDMYDAFEFDSVKSSHPIYVPVENPDQINEIFDKISYSKGGSVIRMLRYVVGEETFRLGLVKYLNQLKYGSAVHDDLWSALQEEVNKEGKTFPYSIKDLMDTWILQMNYPVVMVTRTKSGMKVEQKRFLFNKNSDVEEKFTSRYGYTWKIPLVYTTSNEMDFNKTGNSVIWLDTDSKEINNSDLPTGDNSWYLFNIHQYGYYRVNYDLTNWNSLIHTLKRDHKKIATINRGQLINDAWNLVKANELSITVALNILDYLEKEIDYVPWAAARRELGYIDSMLSKTEKYGDFKNFVKRKVSAPFQRYGLKFDNNMTHGEIYSATGLARTACGYGVETCVNQAKDLFKKWMENPQKNRINPNIKGLVYCSGVAQGGINEWTFVYNQYKKVTVASEVDLLLSALSCTKEAWILNKLLHMTSNSEDIRKQDAPYVIMDVAGNPVGKYLAKEFFFQNWDYIRDTYAGGFGVFIKLVKLVTKSFSTEYELNQLKNFLSSNFNLGPGARAFSQAVENTESNIRWMKSNYVAIDNWLSKSEKVKGQDTLDVRLPRSLIPKMYNLTLKPDFYSNDPSTFSNSGSVSIEMECVIYTYNITLHSVDLVIDKSSIKISSADHQGAAPSVQSLQEDKVRQFLIINLDNTLQAGKTYNLEMTFTGPLSNEVLAGLYVSSYQREDQTVYLATTQFESTDARRAFPCFDEPELKAKFKVTLMRKPDLVSLSNMPLERTGTPGADGYVADEFAVSPNMSTYLLAFIICDFKYTDAVTKNNITYRAWATPETVDQTALALKTGTDTLTFYENFFGIKFPIPKQDMIAIPDFAAGAMENWGLITYRETAMLFDPDVSSASNKQRVVVVITHELAHQWFGNLVTMDWWDDLWLNEGFATFVENLGADHLYPEWRMFDQFTVDVIGEAFSFDGLVSSHPVYVPVANPAEISEIFDAISYSKGGAIIRMMKFFLGDSTFAKGLTGYLQSRKFSNAFHDDLWDAMTKQAKLDGLDLDVKSVMNTWILQMNYPVVMVTRSNGTLHLEQKRFLFNPSATDPGKYPSPFNYKWKIPFTYTSSDQPNFDQTFSDVKWFDFTDKMDIPTSSSGWVIGNIQQYGYYRVNYDDENWQALTNQLKLDHKRIHLINRGQILSDVWSLSKSGDVGILTALQVTDYLTNELDYVPWAAATSELSYVQRMLSRTAIYGKFQKYMNNLLTKAFDHYGLDNTGATHIEAFARARIASEACTFDITKCKTAAVNMFSDWMADPDSYRIDPDLKSTVYCTGIAEGGEEEWDFLYQQYKLSNVAAEKSRILSALACTKETYLLSRYLSYSLDLSEIRSQDASSVIIAISRNDNGRDLAWDFMVENWNKLIERYQSAISVLRKLISGLTDSFNTETDLQKLKDFKTRHPDLGSGSRAYEQAVENTQSNIDWMAKNYQTLEAWLDRMLNSKLKGGNRLEDVRLPRAVIPQLYTLELTPDIYAANPTDFKTSGKVEIEIDCVKDTNNITLHINKLVIDRASVKIITKTGNKMGPAVTMTTEDKDRQFYIIMLADRLKQGQTYIVSMSFEGPLRDDLAGLYYSSYKRDGRNVYLAVTQFEATDARKAFPCFDEPNLKARFKVTLVRKPHMTSISNMPQVQTGVLRSNGYVADVYGVSEKMSTYLLAFIVCDFKMISGKTMNNITYGAWSTAETIDQAKLALQTGIDTITFYEDFFGVKFPLPKQDMIAIPDFSAGAMENWGLITYRETAMLYEPGVSSEGNKERVVSVIAHELAHQWFGDLVTMNWWDDLWLNEGFARFVQHLGADHLYPEWKMFEQFVIDDVHAAFNFDGLVSSHPVYVPVKNPDEINEIFDTISYDKGASIIRMMKFFLGDSTFKKGLQNYLSNRKFKNAVHDDLWNAMTNQSSVDGRHLDVKAVMDTWTLQMNYPVVMVTVMSNGQLQLSQKRFLTNPDAKDPGKYTSPYNYVWKIPFCFTTNKELNFNKDSSDVTWFNSKQKELPAASSFSPETDWVIANVQQFGFYRVNYNEKNWLALIRQLKTDHKVIHTINRAQIINDAWNLAKSGDLDFIIALKTVEYLGDELDYVPWSAAVDQLSYVDNMLYNTELFGKFKKFMKKILNKPFKHYGMDNSQSSHLESYLRSSLTGRACFYGIESCTKEAAKIFNRWMESPEQNRVDPGLKSTVYCLGVASGGEKEWNFVYEKYKKAKVAAEKSRLLSALSCTRQTWILNKFLNMAMNPDQIRKQDATGVISGIHGNPLGRDLVYRFININWKTLFERYSNSPFSMKRVVGTLAAGMNTEYDLKQLKEFQRKHPDVGTGQRALEQGIEKTQANINWMKRYYSVIEKWLDENLQGSETSDYRLSRNVVPSAYWLELFPDIYKSDPSNFTFSGYVKVQVSCEEDANNFTMNSRQITIDETSVSIVAMDANVQSPDFLSLSYNEEQQLVTFVTRNQLIKGKAYFIEMNFTGPLLDDLQGLYYSSYKQGSMTRFVAATQLESTKARKAFPCFDEPDLKATFKVTLVRHKNKISLSNMPVEKKVSRSDGFVADVYKVTPVMSTYLLAFIVGDFNRTTNTTKNGVVYSVWSRPESVEQTRFALDVGTQVLTFYENFFNITFPLPKQDMIAIPDFGPGAMENWGLITYKERYLLYERGVSSESSRQSTATVIAHELGHQWFGNLVTMKWWDDLWLNEGFATFMEFLGTDHIFKDWKMFDQMVVKELHPMLDFDGLVTSHPVYVPLTNLGELSYIFDVISYNKGGSVIRMARHFLGESTFQKGLTRYLNNRKYQNADHDDLSSALNEQAQIDQVKLPTDVKSIMDTWLLQMNYPVVMVTATGRGNLTATQKRFLHNPEAEDPLQYKSPYKWYIPLTITSSIEKDFTKTSDEVMWFNDTTADFTSVSIPMEDGASWILANVGQQGVYRVNYTAQNWRAIIKQLKANHTVISSVNRAQLINDAWSLSRGNQLDTDIALGTVEYLNKEMDYITRYAANRQLDFLDNMLSQSIYYGKFKILMRKFVQDAYKQYGLNRTNLNHIQSCALLVLDFGLSHFGSLMNGGVGVSIKYLRSEISSKACNHDHPECVTEAKEQYKNWMKNPDQNRINPDIRYTVYCTAIRTGDETEWDFAYRQYKQATVASEINNLLNALSCTEVPWLLQRFLQYALTPTEIRKQETGSVLVNVASNPVGRSIASNFVLLKWDYIYDEYLAGYWNGGDVIKVLSKIINTEYQLQQLINFGSSISDLHRADRDFHQAVETAQSNIKWAINSMNKVEKWLEKMIA